MLRSALLSAFVASALGFAPAARRPPARAGALFGVRERSGIKAANADYLERLESSAVAEDFAARAALERTTYLDYLDDALVDPPRAKSIQYRRATSARLASTRRTTRRVSFRDRLPAPPPAPRVGRRERPCSSLGNRGI